MSTAAQEHDAARAAGDERRTAPGHGPGGTGHLIGPNAVLQFLPVLRDSVGDEGLAGMLARAGIREIPDGSCMIDEAEVVRLHQLVRRELPAAAPALARRAGAGTADYIIAHRIPGPVRRLLGVLPAALAEPLLARAIAAHAWTFAGSGTFRVVAGRPLVFEIRDNPLVRGENAGNGVCHWHAAVFEQLFGRLVGGRYRVTERTCAACAGDLCRFELERLPR